MQQLDEHQFPLEPAEIEEWEDEDALAGVLGEEGEVAGPDEIIAMLSAVRLTLPAALTVQDLVSYAAERATDLDAAIRADSNRYDYRLVEVPLNVLVPRPDRLVRLRLGLHIDCDGAEPAVASDLFPPDRWTVGEHDVGEIDLDVSKALKFVCPAPVTDALGLRLKLPLRWRTRGVLIATSDRNSNPAEWYVTDEEIGGCFSPLMIVRSSKGAGVTIRAELAGEIRRRNPLGRLLKGRFRSVRGDKAIFPLL